MRKEFLVERQGRSFCLYAGQRGKLMELPGPIPKGLCRCGCGGKTTIAARNERRRGHVKGEPMPYIISHNAPAWWLCIEIRDAGYSTPCWIWMAAKTGSGYAEKTFARKQTLMHRFVFQWAHGSIPPNLHLDHLCRNTACVNPGHLEPVTSVVNSRRGRGTKLTTAQADEIRSTDAPGVELATRFGVSPQAICDIRKGRKWRPE